MIETNKYIPIDCGFYDRIELAIMRKSQVNLTIEEAGVESTLLTKMLDTVQANGAEFVKLEDESMLRMDQIVSMDGISARDEDGIHCSLNRSF